MSSKKRRIVDPDTGEVVLTWYDGATAEEFEDDVLERAHLIHLRAQAEADSLAREAKNIRETLMLLYGIPDWASGTY